jgi:predicted permease
MRRRDRKALAGLADDLRDHLERQTEENIGRGMTPEEARRQAHIKLGNLALIEEDTRDVWIWRWLEDLRRDLAYARRSLARAPAFAIAAVLTLGLGVGAVASVSTIVYGVLFRPLPFANADRLVRIVQILRLNGAEDRVGLRPEQIASWSINSRFLSAIGYYYGEPGTLTGVATPARLVGATITPALFRATADAPLEGRLLSDDDALPGNTHVVVLAYRTWKNFFSGDPNIVGRAISLNFQPYRVVAVMPQDFDFPSLALTGTTDSSGGPADSPEFWMPLQKTTKMTTSDNDGFTLFGDTFGVLRPGVTVERAAAEANSLLPLQPSRRLPIELTNPRVEQARAVRPLLLLFEGSVTMVLLIACANVTNLLLARAAYRQRELAIRLSLGAGRGRLARQATAEGLLLGAAGAIVGIVATAGGIAWFRTLPPYLLPRMREIHVDNAALLFAVMVALLAGIAVSLAAAGWTLRRGVTSSLRNSAPSVSTTMSRAPLRTLVVIEVAGGVVLFAGAALLLSSLVNLTNIKPEFDARHVFSFQLTLPPRKYDGPLSSVFLRQLSTKLSALPQVTRVTATDSRLETGEGVSLGASVDGTRASGAIRFRTVPSAFFETLGIPLRTGRGFTEADESASPRVAVVNETLARRYWHGANPLGHHISVKLWKDLEIVGVVADTRAGRPDAREYAELYVPVDPTGQWFAPTIFLRTSGDAPLAHEVRSIVSGLDPALVVYRDGLLETAIEHTYADANAYSVSSTTFALLALTLAAIGLHGVLAFTVGARTREIGVRVAIGANRRRIVWMVLHDALWTVGVGIIVGLAAAWYLSRLLQNWLYGVTPHDPIILASVAVLFLTVGALAAYVPARHATLVDPVVALRTE